MKTILRIDVETYSSEDIRKAGAAKYCSSPDFEIMLFGYAYDDEPVKVIDLLSREQFPQQILEDLNNPEILKTAYNANFEINAIQNHFKISLDVTQWRCTSVHALYLGLPGNLADVGAVIGLGEDEKKKNGSLLIRYFCQPCRPTKSNGERTRNLPGHAPDKWQEFKDYCLRDVETERFISKKLSKFPVPEKETRLWHLDQKMMLAGAKIDTELVNRAIEIDEIYKARLTKEAVDLTGLDNPNSVKQLIEWLQKEMDDESIEDLTKASVPKLIESAESKTAERVLQIRQEMAKASVSKYHAMRRAAIPGTETLHGLTQFYGANRTGRFAGRIVQCQNLPANKLKDLDLARRLVKQGDHESIELLFGSPLDVLSQLIRTAFIPRRDNEVLVPVDFSAIEARVIAWMADCRWRLEVFKTHGKIYEASAEQMFKLPAGSVTKKSPYRQKGKVAELALSFLGGVGALKAMGALDMGIGEEELQDIVDAWRGANSEIVSTAYSIERAAKKAVLEKTKVTLPIANGQTTLEFSFESGFLFIKLPSGRRLAYVKPRIETEPLFREKSDGTKYEIARAGSLTYEGSDQVTKKWVRIPTYSGKLIENATQAIARDCLCHSMLTLDQAGVQQLFTVHDEIVCEVDPAITGVKQIEALMGQDIEWAPGLPLRADGFMTPYYCKEVD